MPSPNSNNAEQLADFCAFVVPCIWGDGWAKLGTSTVDAKRYNAFRTFCKDMINATQISSSCILVSLRYIRVLRSCYPSIKGSVGSEFRLFTTSLILANKFLDDNTYTNKTWSEVSNIPVSELNIMEIEFLSALDYNVFVSEEQYLAWMSECDYLISMDTRRKYRPMKTPSSLLGKANSKSSPMRSAAGGKIIGKSTLPPLVHSISQPILPLTSNTSSLKRSASAIQPTPTKRMCLPNTPPPDDMLQYNVLPPLVRSRTPVPSISQFYGSRPQTPIYTPTLPVCNPYVTVPSQTTVASRYTQQYDQPIVPTDKLYSWTSSAMNPPMYFRPQPTLHYRQQHGPLSLAM